jgi:hypothetical protein
VVTTEFVSTRMPLPFTEIEPALETCPAMVLAGDQDPTGSPGFAYDAGAAVDRRGLRELAVELGGERPRPPSRAGAAPLTTKFEPGSDRKIALALGVSRKSCAQASRP